MSHVSICELYERPEAISTVAEWLHQEWLRTHPHEVSQGEIDKALSDRQASLHQHLTPAPIPTTFIAMSQDKPVGSCSLVYYRILSSDIPSVWITNVFVSSVFRGQGVGSELLNVCESYAVIHGIKKISVFTFDAKNYYVDRQWQFVRQRALNGVVVDVLEKRIG